MAINKKDEKKIEKRRKVEADLYARVKNAAPELSKTNVIELVGRHLRVCRETVARDLAFSGALQ